LKLETDVLIIGGGMAAGWAAIAAAWRMARRAGRRVHEAVRPSGGIALRPSG
jgi:succinate dehydrogenase/fumarate reductase flavoprotein subunit